MTSLFHLSSAFQIAQRDTKFHPVRGYYWSTDEEVENAIEKSKHVSSNTPPHPLPTLGAQKDAMEFTQRIDRIIAESAIERTYIEPTTVFDKKSMTRVPLDSRHTTPLNQEISQRRELKGKRKAP